MVGKKRALERATRPKSQAKPATSKSPDRVRFEKVFERVYKMVLRIPPGKVMTYGQIARLLEGNYSPRLIGWAMHATPHDHRNIPWHRVINSKGGISTAKIMVIEDPNLQQYLLEAEGVVFNESGHCSLDVYQWSPRNANRPKGLGRSKRQIKRSRKKKTG